MNTGLCMCGCGESTPLAPRTDGRTGQLKGLPLRYLAGHYGRKSPHEYLEEDRGYKTACWIWQRALSEGYGTLVREGRRTKAYRFFYERKYGPVPNGLELDHLCRVHACVNPDHLEPVTHAENMRRGARTRLSPADVEAVRASNEKPSTLAAQYGISRQQIWAIRTGRSQAAKVGAPS